jgi:hypothetical protein
MRAYRASETEESRRKRLAAFAPPLRSGAASRQTQETLPERTDQTNRTTPIRSQHRFLLKNRRPWLRYPSHLFERFIPVVLRTPCIAHSMQAKPPTHRCHDF